MFIYRWHCTKNTVEKRLKHSFVDFILNETRDVRNCAQSNKIFRRIIGTYGITCVLLFKYNLNYQKKIQLTL